MYVTQEQLQRLYESTHAPIIEAFIDPLNKTLEAFDITTSPRIAMFLAQCGHESAGFMVREENLNYRGDRLAVVFPKYFHDVDVNEYAHNPEKIANRVYADRMGNGPESSGDGYRYRGRGLIQLTGKDNYSRFAHACDMSIEEAVEYMSTPAGAVHSAGWFWDAHKLNDPSDNEDVERVTRIINGGTIGLAQRAELFREAKEILGD